MDYSEVLNNILSVLKDLIAVVSFLAGFLVGKSLFKWLGG